MQSKILYSLTAVAAVCMFTAISCKKNDAKRSTTDESLEPTQEIQAVYVKDSAVNIPITSRNLHLNRSSLNKDSVLTGRPSTQISARKAANADISADGLAPFRAGNLGPSLTGIKGEYILSGVGNGTGYIRDWYLTINGVRERYLGTTNTDANSIKTTSTWLSCGYWYEMSIDTHLTDASGNTVISTYNTNDSIHAYDLISGAGLGNEGQGADVAIGDIDRDGKPDLVFMANDNPSGENFYRYYVNFAPDQNGLSTKANDIKTIPTGLSEVDGSGMALIDLDGNKILDLVFVSYDDPAGTNSFVYTIGWNLQTNGNATSWSTPVRIPGLSDYGKGADVAFADFDMDGVLDIILMCADAPTSGIGTFRYKIGYKFVNGVADHWGTAGSFALEGNINYGFGLDFIALNNDVPFMALYGVVEPTGYKPYSKVEYRYVYRSKDAYISMGSYLDNNFYYHQMGTSMQGAGFAQGDLDGDKRNDMVMMTYDNPAGANSFHYYILYGYNPFFNIYGTESFKGSCNH